ncbi:bifunctional folylpolyglutamate synthase/dihydrofolate synthase [Desulfofundulus thermobenzoicus]|uniref:tetrahydrofolate synthase n=2 Tax=Desulfofundulus thermobenzoicus TaxID=29376 RepID=A0A6N7ISC5_9FIRM|nr:folylpolyglutamate synthase/dihydrofolate synthase family protein [Desulfofundulus thermobenzoicus]MQL53045.1 bifunctional folylpolyglutamate synthase/dihydrofolate synthase [Desulfofundulus thermobenzoicus]
MQYDEAMSYLQNLTKFGFNFGLGRIQELLRRLGDPQDRLKVVHVGGTNGKGSTLAMVASVLSAAGYATGAFTSPHLHSYTERYQINGVQISPERVAALITGLKPHLEAMVAQGFEHPTEFEVSTAMAFQYFYEEGVDFLVLEVGLGGAIDSTNVVKNPLVTVITNVAMDHMDYLGHTIKEIATVKAGIIKPGAPLVTACTGEALAVMERFCREKGAPMVLVEGNSGGGTPGPVSGSGDGLPGDGNAGHAGPTDSQVREKGHSAARVPLKPEVNGAFPLYRTVFWEAGPGSFDLGGQYLTVHGLHRIYRDLFIPLLGRHQLANAAGAVAVVELLAEQGYPVSEAALYRGLAAVRWPARLEIVSRDPLVLLDGAHNYDGAGSLARALDDYFSGKGVVLVIGMLGDKERGRVIHELAPRSRAVVVTKPNSPRAGDWQRLAVEARKYTPEVYTIESIPGAVRHALSLARPGELVCITGSLYMVAEARELFLNRDGTGN